MFGSNIPQLVKISFLSAFHINFKTLYLNTIVFSMDLEFFFFLRNAKRHDFTHVLFIIFAYITSLPVGKPNLSYALRKKI